MRSLTALLLLSAINTYVPEVWRFVALTGTAFVLFGLGTAKRHREPLVYAAVFCMVGAWIFLAENFGGRPPFAPHFAGLFLILLAQQLGRKRLPAMTSYAIAIQATLIAAGVLGVWLLMGRIVAQVQSGFLITISWSLLAFVVLGAGFLLKERTYRLLGLGLLTISIGRVFLVDVWQLDTIYRILSFLVLGVVLLALGFLYNRFAGAVRKWI